MKFCDKCRIKGHHSFLCNKYEKWAEETCNRCRNGKHLEEDCKNAPINPPIRKESYYTRDYKNAKGKNVEKINFVDVKADEAKIDLRTALNLIQAQIEAQSEN